MTLKFSPKPSGCEDAEKFRTRVVQGEGRRDHRSGHKRARGKGEVTVPQARGGLKPCADAEGRGPGGEPASAARRIQKSRLAALEGGTILTYDAKQSLGGVWRQSGKRLIDGSAKSPLVNSLPIRGPMKPVQGFPAENALCSIAGWHSKEEVIPSIWVGVPLPSSYSSGGVSFDSRRKGNVGGIRGHRPRARLLRHGEIRHVRRPLRPELSAAVLDENRQKVALATCRGHGAPRLPGGSPMVREDGAFAGSVSGVCGRAVFGEASSRD